LLLKILIFERFSMIMAVIYSMLACILFNGQIPGSLNIEACLYFLFFQFTGIILLKNVEDRIQLFKTALGMTIINVMIVTMFIFLSIEKFHLTDFLLQSSFVVSAAILSIVFTI